MGLQRQSCSSGAGLEDEVLVDIPEGGKHELKVESYEFNYDDVIEVEKTVNKDLLSEVSDTEVTGCFNIVQIPGKGTGVVSRNKLYPGDLIMIEKPLIVVKGDIYDDLEKVKSYLDKVVTKMSSSDREVFLNLTDCQQPEDPTYLGTFDTNDMDFGGDAAVLPTMARVNHSCQPNAEFVTDQGKEFQKLVAIDIIDKDEEITINYLPMEEEGTDIREIRQRFLRTHYGFTCSCRCCSKENEPLFADDAVRETTKELQAAGFENLCSDELESVVKALHYISSKYAYILLVLDAIYSQNALQDQGYAMSVAVRGLTMASKLYGWTDVRTDSWQHRAELGAEAFKIKII